MPRRRPGFLYAPEPAEDELLSSWVHRIALRQEVNGSTLVGRVDIDWDPPTSLLAWLARNGEQPLSRLKSMTLREKFPDRARRDFAFSKGSAFPGCHAYCPICALDDINRYGGVILRASNAGLWRLTCEAHRCFLQSAKDENQLTPHWRFADRSWAHGRNLPLEPLPAPAVAIAFERAMARAIKGRDPGPLWLERTPSGFKDAATVLANLCMVIRRVGSTKATPAWALLGGRHPEIYHFGVESYDAASIRSLESTVRVLAAVAAARLLLSRKGSDRIGDDLWWPSPWRRWSSPWQAATEHMRVSTWGALWATSVAWGEKLRSEIRGALTAQYASIGASPPVD
ncbi:TniQ family protein [Brevundimonas sp.]|uniref:TniQ family protein n=1 Tax=Brevundimonas sp. TaxID=1871086 RepID=UPI003D0B4F2B